MYTHEVLANIILSNFYHNILSVRSNIFIDEFALYGNKNINLIHNST